MPKPENITTYYAPNVAGNASPQKDNAKNLQKMPKSEIISTYCAPNVAGNASSPIAYWVAFGAPDRSWNHQYMNEKFSLRSMHWIIAVFCELIFGITTITVVSLITVQPSKNLESLYP